jgi:type II secretory ATPase GspE/PulE/Tfp pilus assembly ATPase PilB-like protein
VRRRPEYSGNFEKERLMADMISILDNSELLSSFPQAYKEKLSAHLVKQEFQKGQVIFNEGDPGDMLYIIEVGCIGVFVADKIMGFDFEIARLKDQACFGEMALITGEPRSATCRAIETTVAYSLSAQIFNALLNGAPQMAAALCRTLAKRLQAQTKAKGVQFQSLASARFDPVANGMVPEPIQTQHKIVPVSYIDGILTVATPNPQNAMGLDAVKRVVRGAQVKPILVSEEDYQKFSRLSKAQGPRPSVGTAVMKKAMNIKYISDADDKDDKLRPQPAGEDPVAVITSIFAEALSVEASDIHIEPEREGTLVRYRVEGKLKKRDQMIPRSQHKALISRLKVLATLDIAEKRLSQDGRISLNADGRDIDVRLNTMPTKNGEKAVMRILDASSSLMDLSRVILSDKLYQAVRRMVFEPHGVVLITGPTGSGKTTTMYSMLMERKAPDINIVTVEDPIEYSIAGTTQTQINEAINLGYPEMLRSFLRQDTDIILVGETRDSKTAKMAFEAGLTGKLVITSFHTNDTVSAIVRLREMGCEQFTISNALQGIICQRLLRRLCPACCHQYKYPDAIMKSLVNSGVFPPDSVPDSLYQPKGCPSCNNAGFKGRVVAADVLIINDQIRQLIGAGASPTVLEKVAYETGARVSFARYGAFLLSNKLTVPGELLTILSQKEALG